jgi:hypothetical protein
VAKAPSPTNWPRPRRRSPAAPIRTSPPALDELTPATRAAAGAQFDEALADHDQSTELIRLAQQLQDKLSQAGPLTHGPTGTLVYQPSGSTAIGKGAKAVGTIKVKKGNVTL